MFNIVPGQRIIKKTGTTKLFSPPPWQESTLNITS